jgi:uncharacterized protein YllA (UPF0747 family)
MNKERLKWIISGLDFDSLTDWEQRFIEDCERRMERYGSITDRMEEIVERIYKEKGA